MTDLERDRVRAAVRASIFGCADEPVAVGRYRIERRIGSGGTAVVYAATDPELDRTVAIKVVSSGRMDPELREQSQHRLLREGRALASLRHPNVVSVFDVGTAAGDVYLALELVDGESLSAWVGRVDPDWRGVLDVVMPAGEGLDAAHAAGLVHRDVTPGNIVIDARGGARLVDFGLVSAPEVAVARAVSPVAAIELTQTGVALGTPRYMAPEQWLRGVVDARTDQFGFCATLFEALHRRAPFAGDSVDELRAAITAGQVSEDAGGPRVPAWLDAVVARGLAVEPGDRYPSMAELLDDVRRHLTGMDEAARGEALLGRLRGLLAAADRDVAAIDGVAVDVRAAYDASLAAWPGHDQARVQRDDALAMLVDHELDRGNPDVAAPLIDALSEPRADLTARLAAVRDERHRVASRLRKLDAIEHDANIDLASEWKAGLLGLVAAWQGAVFLGFGYLDRGGRFDVGPLWVAGFFALHLTLHLASDRVAGHVYRANALNRKLYLFGFVTIAGHCAMFVLAELLGLTVAEAFSAAYVMSTAVWATAGATSDPRFAYVAPVTVACLVATALWPAYCFEIHAASAVFGIGATAFAVRPRTPAAGTDRAGD